MSEIVNDKKVFSLLEVTQSIQKVLADRYKSSFWVKAEMIKLNHYKQSGHCYPDLVEKKDGAVVAQMRANLWKEDYLRTNQKFIEILKEPLKDGIKLLFLAKITFEPSHGLALRILDIQWRFEFPEVLDNEGRFVGFDVVIGNPTYIRQEEFSASKPYLQSQYETHAGTADWYVYFVEKGLKIGKQGGHFVYILPNKWMRAGYGLGLRKWVKNYTINAIIDFGDLQVFEEATTYPCIWFIKKCPSMSPIFKSAQVDTLQFENGLDKYLTKKMIEVDQKLLPDTDWTLVDDRVQKLLEKIKKAGMPFGEYVQGKIFYGIKTGFNEAFVIDSASRDRLIKEDPQSEEIIKPFMAGRDIKRYKQPKSDKYLILFKSGQTKEMLGI